MTTLDHSIGALLAALDDGDGDGDGTVLLALAAALAT